MPRRPNLLARFDPERTGVDGAESVRRMRRDLTPVLDDTTRYLR